jgi:hypothetical protein
MATALTLKLVCESKICDLLPWDPRNERWEASGVLVKDRHFFVVFDDRTEPARLADDLQPNSTNGLFGMAHGYLIQANSLPVPGRARSEPRSAMASDFEDGKPIARSWSA